MYIIAVYMYMYNVHSVHVVPVYHQRHDSGMNITYMHVHVHVNTCICTMHCMYNVNIKILFFYFVFSPDL